MKLRMLRSAFLMLVFSTAVLEAQVVSEQESPVAVYKLVRPAVVQVLSGISSGSGFLVDDEQLGRIVITNAHVVSAGQPLSVILVDSIRVPANLILNDQRADLAVLRANTSLCSTCTALRLRAQESGRPPPGTPVFAVGYPLGLGSIFSGGIVTGQSQRLLLSDVDINPGNSGGPLVDKEGTVVGVNTFIRPSQTGPGISGIIDSNLVHDALTSAHLVDVVNAMASSAADSTLPMLDLPAYPIDELLAIADSVDFEQYKDFGDLESQDFRLSIFTPVSLMALAREQERQVVHRRREREADRGVLRLNWYTERTEFRQWHEDLGDITRPYVVVRIQPKTGETTGSIIGDIVGGILGGAAAAATGSPYMVGDYRDEYEFKGDLAGTSFFRVKDVDTDEDPWAVEGDSIVPIIGGTRPVRVFASGGLVEFRDVAFEGTYILHPDTFRPDSSGTPPHIMLRFKDLTNDEDDDYHLYEMPPEVASRIWNDFRPYYEKVLGEDVPRARLEDIDWHCGRTWSRCSRM